jgi:hypothetical protein
MMLDHTCDSSTVTLADDELAALRQLMADVGIRKAHISLHICRHAMERAAGGLTIRRGTAALIRMALASQVQQEPRP